MLLLIKIISRKVPSPRITFSKYLVVLVLLFHHSSEMLELG